MNRFNDRKLAELAHEFTTFDLDEVLDIAIKEIPSIIGAHRISIYLLDDQEKYLIAKRHSSKKLQGVLNKISIKSNQSLIPEVFKKQKSLMILDTAEYIEKNNLSITLSKKQRYSGSSCMLIPILLKLPNKKEKYLGVINIAEKIDFTPFSKKDLELANYVGELLATSIHNCHVMEKKLGGRHKELLSELSEVKEAYAEKDLKLDEAKKKQIQMLPELPDIPNYSIDVHYSPMETIGGDFYDFIQIKENEIGIVVGDVSGHGIEAALVMSMAKHILSIYSKLYGSLTETLIHANEEICSSLKGESFVAVFLGILNTDTNVLRYARAGQTYPLIYNPQRQEEPFELKTSGIVLGTVRGDLFKSKIEEKHLRIVSGDSILLYTDGVVEAQNKEKDEYSLQRLMEKVVELYPKSASEINTDIKNDIDTHIDSEQTDDITILCIKAGDIKHAVNYNTQRVQKQILEDAESFIISPEFSHNEESHIQIVELEKEINQLQTQLKEAKEENKKLEDQYQEMDVMLDLAENDPDSLIKMLRDQLKIALELPKNLIVDNKELHDVIEEQRKELRTMELDLNDLVANSEALNNKYKKLQERYAKQAQELSKKMLNNLKNDIEENSEHFTEKIFSFLHNSDYKNALKKFSNLSQMSEEQGDVNTLASIQKQLLKLNELFIRNFGSFSSNKVSKKVNSA